MSKKKSKEKEHKDQYFVYEYPGGDIEDFESLSDVNEYIRTTCEQTGTDSGNFRVFKGIELPYTVIELSYPEFEDK